MADGRDFVSPNSTMSEDDLECGQRVPEEYWLSPAEIPIFNKRSDDTNSSTDLGWPVTSKVRNQTESRGATLLSSNDERDRSEMEQCGILSAPASQNSQYGITSDICSPGQSSEDSAPSPHKEGVGYYPKCGRPFVPKELVPETYIQDNADHVWMQPHRSREISVEAHYCPCCNHPTPHMYECCECFKHFIVTKIDDHEQICVLKIP